MDNKTFDTDKKHDNSTSKPSDTIAELAILIRTKQ